MRQEACLHQNDMNNYFKKIIPYLLVLTLLMSILTIPKKAGATGYSAVTEVGPSLYQQIAHAASGLTTSFATYSLQLKAFVYDTLATTLAKTLIRQLTASVVNWINSGFEGSPSFLTNPGSFFLDVADQVSGDFLATCGSLVDQKQIDGTIKKVCSGRSGPLSNLCSPFSIDIRLKLAFKYHPKIQQKYACTLGTIIQNSKVAGNNATINGRSISGFMNGDFSQGGLPAFVSLTTEPQNNPFGAYLEADSELGIRVANAHIQQRDEIGAGKGFMSWRSPSCMKQVRQAQKYQKDAAADPTGEDTAGQEAKTAIYNSGGDLSESGPTTAADCPIQTPGSLIGDTLTSHIVGPLTELELVDSINQIVNALAAQLVNTVLQGGLRAVSGSGPSDSSSYLNRIQAEANSTNSAQFKTVRDNFISSIEKYIGDTFQYKNNKNQSLNTILDAKKSYEDVRACYTLKIVSFPQYAALAQSKIGEIDSLENVNVNPLATKLLEGATSADSRYKALTDLRDQAKAAKTVNDINEPSQVFSQMLQNQNLITMKDIIESQQELEQTQTAAASIKQDAGRKLQACQIFPGGFSTQN